MRKWVFQSLKGSNISEFMIRPILANTLMMFMYRIRFTYITISVGRQLPIWSPFVLPKTVIIIPTISISMLCVKYIKMKPRKVLVLVSNNEFLRPIASAKRVKTSIPAIEAMNITLCIDKSCPCCSHLKFPRLSANEEYEEIP